jgi:hypothetical protein
VAGVVTLARALADGGSVVWDTPPDKPRLRAWPRWHRDIERDREEVCEVLRRAVCFRQQLAAPGPVPFLRLPGAPDVRDGCLSCGVLLQGGFRCPLCALAAWIALDLRPPILEPTGEPPAPRP